jgi:hypothetical protein
VPLLLTADLIKISVNSYKHYFIEIKKKVSLKIVKLQATMHRSRYAMSKFTPGLS